MIHDHPEWDLNREYVDALFEHESTAPKISDTELERKIEAAGEGLAKLIALREQRAKDAEAEAAERAELEKKAKLAEIEDADKVAAQANAKLAALKAELGPDAP